MSLKVRQFQIVAGIAGSMLVLYSSSAAASALSGSAALTSDYVWRGSSQTQEEPAIQAGFDVAHASGIYASVWGSNVDFGPAADATSEFDLTLGWAVSLAPEWALDASVVRYMYPAAADDLNWNELNLGVTWKKYYSLSVAYSDDVMASDTDGYYALLTATLPLGEAVSVTAGAGHYFLDDAFADSYSHAALTLGWMFSDPFTFSATLHGTDSNARQLFPDMAGTRAEFALTATF